MVLFGTSRTGSEKSASSKRILDVVKGWYTKLEAPGNKPSRALRYRPARALTKARIKNHMIPGDTLIEKGKKLIEDNSERFTDKEKEVWKKGIERLNGRKNTIMKACNARILSLKVHLSPFVYNRKAQQWYDSIQVILEEKLDIQGESQHPSQLSGRDQGEVAPTSSDPGPVTSFFDKIQTSVSSGLSSLGKHMKYEMGPLTSRFSGTESSSREERGNALGITSFVPHPFDDHGFWTPEFQVALEHSSPANMSTLVEWLDETLKEVERGAQADDLREFLREVCLSPRPIESSRLASIKEIIGLTSQLDSSTFIDELVRRRDACLHLSLSSPTALDRSLSSPAIDPEEGEEDETKDNPQDDDGLLLPFQQLHMRGPSSSALGLDLNAEARNVPEEDSPAAA